MFLGKWRNHLSLKPTSNSYWDVTSDYFSFPNIVDMYNIDSSNFLSFSALLEEFKSIYNDSVIIDLSIGHMIDGHYNFNNESLNVFNSINISTLIELSTLKGEVDELTKIFPSMEDDIELLDLWTRFGEEYLQEVESTPDVKLYYPEPFIASPSFVHEELWFIHILHYQHWLWFMFISLIMFYFITFINVVRWCNLRNKPKRETRGVSRSKCADLITASVPVSWAASIIISETVDATDYYDGFGTGEIVVGIRAYQWGWEYFYPKSIDLNYNVKPSYSTFIGNSLKYNNSNLKNLDSNSFWKSYQGKSIQSVTVSPSHLLLSPSDSSNLVNIADFSKVGLSSLKDSSAFKKVQYYSKSPSSQLFDSSTLGYSKFDVLNKLYTTTNNLTNSKDYYTDRQDNYTSLLASQLSSKSNLESKSVDKYLNYNFNVNSVDSQLSSFNSLSNSLDDNYYKDLSTTNRIKDTISSTLEERSLPSISTDSASYNINNTTDGKFSSNPVKSLLAPNNRKPSIDAAQVSNLDLINNNYDASTIASKFSNLEASSKFKDLKSPNMGFLSSDKNSRLISKLHTSKGQFNLSDKNSNLADIMSQLSSNSSSSSESAIYSSSSNDWVPSNTLNKLSSFNSSTGSLNSPIYSNDSNWQDKSFNKFHGEQAPRLFKSKEETAPSHLFSEYWDTVWSNSSNNNRIINNLISSKFMSDSYIPKIEEYSEYDFKNWQALESLEDCFWETTFSSFTQEEYLNSLSNFNEASLLKRQEELYNSLTRAFKFKNAKMYNSIKATESLNSIPNYSKEGFINTPLVTKKGFNSVYNETTLDNLDESYESFKSFSLNLLAKNNLISNISLDYIQPYSYAKVVDPFRADYEDLLWNFDSQHTNFSSSIEDSLSARVSNPMKLRTTTRAANISYSAMQKVFKSRFDEGRAHTRMSDFSNSYTSHNFITAPKASYSAMLSKNQNYFFDVNLYSQSYANNTSILSSVYNSLNSTHIDIPFLISTKSDSSRFLWFDWQARWSSTEVQSSSISARYTLSGTPYYSKNLEFDTQGGDTLNESENYLNRLARARKNYLSNWAQSPFFYLRAANTSWDFYNSGSSDNIKVDLLSATTFWKDNTITGSTSTLFTPSTSFVNSPARSSWRPISGTQAAYYDISTLIDILSKREHLYRSYINSLNLVANLPSHMTASPTNPIVNEISKGYGYIDPTSFSSELSRELMYSDLNYVKLNLLVDLYKQLNNTINSTIGVNTTFLNNYLFKYLLGSDNSESLGKNQELLKNQYRPMKKGVTNMIKLQATGAIAMPIEIRLHILASSRDVIHSWAIPSAGIKIDCVPGYSSHRITIFLVSGIFWGQCMEICGRFHHWMPIIVYFMKRDMFFLWCTHFLHYNTDLDIFDMTDKQLSDKLKVASFDKTSWVNEINKVL